MADDPTLPSSRSGVVSAPLPDRLRTPVEVAATLLLGVGLPALGYVGLARAGLDVREAAYVLVAVGLVATAAGTWVEGLLALGAARPPAFPERAHPPASAVVVASLPEEAATARATVDALLAADYPAPLQVVLAYHAPHDLPVERELRELAARDPRLVPVRVAGSSSPAGDVAAALEVVTGEVVGVFAADQQPDPRSFARAWRWLSNGYDVVHGRSVVRNGAASLAARVLAVEFESVSGTRHPGRSPLHRCGELDGAGGFWRSDVLRRLRSPRKPSAGDVGSAGAGKTSGRPPEQAYRIAADPGLVTFELAPTRWRRLWARRVRWAQDSLQSSGRQLRTVLTSAELPAWERAAALVVLAWRVVQPWVSLQVLPLLALEAVAPGPGDPAAPLVVLVTLGVLAVGPGQVLFAYLVAHPSVKRHRGWFALYLAASVVHVELTHLAARVAQVRQLAQRPSRWRSPRPAPSPSPSPSPTSTPALVGDAREQAA